VGCGCGSHKAYDLDGRPVDLPAAPMSEVLKTGRAVRDREVSWNGPMARGSRSRNSIRRSVKDGCVIGGLGCFQDSSELECAQEIETRALQLRLRAGMTLS
jgi:hypothetical protein